MIEDKELRELFKIECAEHLQRIGDGVLALEKSPQDTDAIEEVFREIHSLKGAARMVGVTPVELIGHRIEQIVGAVRRGERAFGSGTADRLYKSIDAMRRLVDEAVTGKPANISASQVLESLKEEAVGEKTASREDRETGEARAGAQPGNWTSPVGMGEAAIPKPWEQAFRIETVRVGTKVLDTLVTQAGELSVTNTYMARRVAELEEILSLWEELDRDLAELNSKIPLPRSKFGDLASQMRNLRARLGVDSAKLDLVARNLAQAIRSVRLIPLSTLFLLFPRMARDMAKERSKEVEIVMEGGETAADKRIVEEMKDPLMHMVRNAIDHGIEDPEERVRAGKPRSGRIAIKGYQAAGFLVIEISDDGKGLDLEAIGQAAVRHHVCSEDEISAMLPSQIEALIFRSGVSTSSFVTEVSGRGVGLDVVRANVERLKGSVSVENAPGKGCKLQVRLPVTLATARVLIVESGRQNYAIPVEYVETSQFVSMNDVFAVAGRNTITYEGQPVSVAHLNDLLEVEGRGPKAGGADARGVRTVFPCVLLSANNERLGIMVDDLVDEQEVIVKPQSAILKRVRNVSGTTVLATGEVCTILNPQDMLKSIRKLAAPAAREGREAVARRKSILLVEDSITTRTQEKRILDGAGYEVVTAVDGLDALTKLGMRSFDAVVSDVMMPNMDGLRLTEKIRQDKRLREMPVVLVTTLSSDTDRKRGMEIGANAYIVKPGFDQKAFLDILKRLV